MPLHATGPQDSVDTGFGAAPELGVAVSSLVAPGSGGVTGSWSITSFTLIHNSESDVKF